jgi:hypothetical protein
MQLLMLLHVSLKTTFVVEVWIPDSCRVQFRSGLVQLRVDKVQGVAHIFDGVFYFYQPSLLILAI